ncbi:ABC transporter ATP-binding protein [Candidatus Saccharibacteria bacterium]|nr:MAG: ABC transporter ATP-binding protein [Candidatus Saccharibacteria bacterium]
MDSSTSAGSSLIKLDNISRMYKTNKDQVGAIKNVSFAVNQGESIAITGPSGSGKSTLLQLIGCLDKPTSGSVYIGTKRVNNLSDANLSELRNNTIGFVFQSFYLQPFLCVEDNIAVPAMFSNKKPAVIKEKVKWLLDEVGLADRAKHFPNELSGGEAQRAAIARSLINEPSIILADEPTGNLDSANSQSIVDLFKKIRDSLGTTVVIVTHNSEVAAQADRAITLKDGELV